LQLACLAPRTICLIKHLNVNEQGVQVSDLQNIKMVRIL
jgi:hypothetical protein